jgi:UPF0716 protein FxsA
MGGILAPVFLRLLLLFTVVPFIELVLLIEIGRRVGFPATLALIVVTGVVGAWLARLQGLRTLAEVQREVRAGHLPGASLVDGLLILVAGAVLLTPGVLTDVCGFVLLVPASRRLVREALRRRFEVSIEQRGPRVIDAEWTRGDPDGD